MTRQDEPKAPARLGWMVTAVAMAAVLVIGAWLNYRVVRAAVDTLNLGQAELLENAMRMPRGGEVDQASLQEVLETHAAAGLRYVAVLGPNDSVVAEAGTSSAPLTRPAPGPDFTGRVVAVGDRMRSFRPMPPARPSRGQGDRPEPPDQRAEGGDSGREDTTGAGATDRGGPPSPQEGAARPDRPDRHDPFRNTYWAVIEFDPVAAEVLAGGRRNLGLSALAAALLLSLAALSWRTWERYESVRRIIEEQERLAALGQMSAVLAHEIRNPLASLKGNAQLVAEKLPEDSPDRKRVTRVVSEAQRLEALTADLLDFSRTGPVQLSEVDPIDLARQLIEDVDGGPFDLETHGTPRNWTADASRVRQALLNVLMNARQASGDGLVTVRVDQGDDELVFDVKDSGAGLPTGEESRIFDPFFTTRTSGTGLGLAVARAAVEKHGGRIDARNHEGGGAVFRIAIPKGRSR